MESRPTVNMYMSAICIQCFELYCELYSDMFPTEECGSPIPIERPTLTEMEATEKAVCYSMCAQSVSSYVLKLHSV